MLSPTADRSRRAKLRPLLAVAATCAIAGAAPATSAAVTGSGTVKLTVGGNGATAKSFAAAGVKTSAIAPAKKRGKRVTLPVRAITVGKSATIALRGGIGFKAGQRALELKSVSAKVTATKVTVSARAGGRAVPIFAAKFAKGKAKLDRGAATAKLAGATLDLTPKGAKLLRAKLAVGDIKAGPLGQLGVDAKSKSAGGGPTKPGGGGPGGSDVPKAGPIVPPSPPPVRPATAVDVTSASLTWKPRRSWIDYINTGEGTSVFDSAVNGPAEPPSGLVYSFLGFPLAGGSWYDPATGAATINFQGGVGFRYSGHGINFSAASPEIEIAPSASRAIFTFNGTQSTPYDNQRGVLVDLHPAAIQKPPTGTVTYTDIPATVPEDSGASVFAGFYPPNAEFGSMTVSFTTP